MKNKVWLICDDSNACGMDVTFKEKGRICLPIFDDMPGVKINDVVYIYRKRPFDAIQWKCFVADINFYLNESANDGYIHCSCSEDADFMGPCVELVLDRIFKLSDTVSSEVLREYDYEGDFVNPSVLNEVTATYLLDNENMYDSEERMMSHIYHLLDFDELSQLAYEHSIQYPFMRKTFGEEHYEDLYVTGEALRAAMGRCMLCGREAPFRNNNGIPFLEIHHVVPYEEGGKHIVGNVVALCPNCHRRIHVLNDKNDIAKLFDRRNKF